MSGGEELKQTAGYPVSKRTSARYQGTFAYTTVRDRMPKVLVQVIDTVHKEAAKHGEAGTEDIKKVLHQLSKLRYELETDKAMVPIAVGPDVEEWKATFDAYSKCQGREEPKWYEVSWLFAECFMYRKTAEILNSSVYLKDFDPFSGQKEQVFNKCMEEIVSVADYLSGILKEKDRTTTKLRIEFEHFLLLCLWGNKMDLSMMMTVESYDNSHSSPQQMMKTNILADHSTALWELLQLVSKPHATSRRIDYVLDNAGFEIFVDIAFAEWLLSVGLADTIHFHLKQVPWFVSDALIKDFWWTMNTLASSQNKNLSDLGNRWKERVSDGTFVLTDHPFWTTSYEYSAMKAIAPDLYSELSKSYLVFFKGDLNYRKLLADRNWLYTESFSIALEGFEPTNICALRTLKADLVTGLKPGVADRAATEDKDWMITGQYAVLQMHRSNNE